MARLRTILAKNLKAYRNERRLSQEALAELVRSSSNYISMIENAGVSQGMRCWKGSPPPWTGNRPSCSRCLRCPGSCRRRFSPNLRSFWRPNSGNSGKLQEIPVIKPAYSNDMEESLRLSWWRNFAKQAFSHPNQSVRDPFLLISLSLAKNAQ